MKKTNNKGFSLVELIVVVAIMAVLMVVLAPQYLRYVERTRLQKDNSAIAEIANAMKVAMADETINSKTPSGTKVTITCAADSDATITFGDASVKKPDSSAATELANELEAVIGKEFKTASNAYKESATPIVLEIVVTDGSASIKVTGFINAVGDAPTGTTPEGGTEIDPKVF